MSMKKIGQNLKKTAFLSVALVASAMPVAAQQYEYMQFTLANGETQNFKAEGLKLTFSGGNAVVESADGDATFALSSLASMAFTGGSSAVGGVMDGDGDGEVTVFTPQGCCIGTFKNAEEAVNGLPRGIYLVRQNGKTVKKALR